MSALGKKLPKNAAKDAINNRYKWAEWVANDSEDDDPEFDYLVRVLLRTSLTNGEVQLLADFKGKNEELWEIVYPYVKEWNITWFDGKDVYEVLPPQEGGVESFRYAPPNLCYAIVNALTTEGFRKVDPKSSKPAESTE